MPAHNSCVRQALLDRRGDSIVVGDGQTDWSAARMLAMVEQMSAWLVQHQLDKVALYSDNSPQWLALDLACQQADVVLLPLPLFFSDAQIEHALSASGIDKLIVSAAAVGRRFLEAFNADVPLCEGLTLYRPVSEGTPELAALPLKTQKITFTSGSTGAPKGVCLSVQQQLNVAQALANKIEVMPVRHLCLLPLSTLLENIGGVYAPLLGGGSIVVPPLADVGINGSSGIEAERLLSALNRFQPNSIILLPQLLTLLVTAVEQGWSAPESLSFIAVGGGIVSCRLIERACELGLPVHQGYGLSECASVVCLNGDSPGHPESVGQALEHIAVTLENEEIVVSGNTFLGYVNDRESWGQERVYTGDLGVMDAEGYLKVTGRRKNVQISSFGRNINPEWIESELMASPLIMQAAVYTEAKPWCSALIVPSSADITEKQIDDYLQQVNEFLPDYAKVKTWLRIREKFSVSNQQLTENGRLKRDRIYACYQDSLNQLYENQREKKLNVIF